MTQIDQTTKMSPPLACLCPICGNADRWEAADQYRYKPQGMALCLGCGFVTYPAIVNAPAKLKEYYREEYRNVPTVQNAYTGQRKLHYHGAFLAPLFESWKRDGLRSPDVFEIGAATGLTLAWLRGIFPEASVRGSELTTSYRRNAWHENGVWLGEEFDDTREYDLIWSYKVAEHLLRPDVELRRYALALKPEGRLYVSIPAWFGELGNFGKAGFSLGYYYDKNHVNVWTRRLFETLLMKCGLEVLAQNHVYYGETYLCRRNDAMMKERPRYEDPADIRRRMAAVLEASRAFDEGRFDDAVMAYPNFPEAHVGRYESTRKAKHQLGFDGVMAEVVGPALEASPDVATVELFAADLCMRYDRWELALEHLERAVLLRPNDPQALMNTAQCFQNMAKRASSQSLADEYHGRAQEVLRVLRATSKQMEGDATTWLYAVNARIPMPDVDPALAGG